MIFARSDFLNVRGLHLLLSGKQFLQSKRQGMWSARSVGALRKPVKEQSMEYLILVAVGSMMALYALIIGGCLKQPEW